MQAPRFAPRSAKALPPIFRFQRFDNLPHAQSCCHATRLSSFRCSGQAVTIRATHVQPVFMIWKRCSKPEIPVCFAVCSVHTGSDVQPQSLVQRQDSSGDVSGGRGVPDLKSSLQQRQRWAGSGSPAPSVGPEGSTSSQTRGLKRLTRKLSFRQRQAQANLQVRIYFV